VLLAMTVKMVWMEDAMVFQDVMASLEPPVKTE
jgi:hypothetical protein